MKDITVQRKGISCDPNPCLLEWSVFYMTLAPPWPCSEQLSGWWWRCVRCLNGWCCCYFFKGVFCFYYHWSLINVLYEYLLSKYILACVAQGSLIQYYLEASTQFLCFPAAMTTVCHRDSLPLFYFYFSFLLSAVSYHGLFHDAFHGYCGLLAGHMGCHSYL